MEALLSASDSRKADHYTIHTLGIPETVLMEHAALAVVSAIENRFHRLVGTKGLIVGGVGNNGGDAFAVARLASHWGAQVTVVALGEAEKRTPSCALELSIVQKLQLPIHPNFDGLSPEGFDWIVDGVFGTGLTRDLDGLWLSAIRWINLAHAHVVAVDIPSGLDADTGHPKPEAVQAHQTVALGFHKKGLVTGLAAEYVGRLRLATIQIPRHIPQVRADGFLYSRFDAALPPRSVVGHKGLYGHVYVVCGEQDKEGASGLVALAALKTGAGLATVVGEKLSLLRLQSRLPVDLMTVEYSDSFFSGLKDGAVVVGPGLGKSALALTILKKAIESSLPLVVDADALSLLAAHPDLAKSLEDRKHTVLTPHPKEAAVLLGTTVEAIQADRFKAVHELCEKYAVACLLKGKGTLIAVPQEVPTVVTAGSSALSKAGTGDILAGVIATLLAQKLELRDALPLAAYLHGRASEIAADSQGTERSALASEIALHLTSAIREIE